MLNCLLFSKACWAFAGSLLGHCWILLYIKEQQALDTICNKHPLPFTLFSLLYFTSCGYSETKVKRKV